MQAAAHVSACMAHDGVPKALLHCHSPGCHTPNVRVCWQQCLRHGSCKPRSRGCQLACPMVNDSPAAPCPAAAACCLHPPCQLSAVLLPAVPAAQQGAPPAHAPAGWHAPAEAGTRHRGKSTLMFLHDVPASCRRTLQESPTA